MTLCDLLREEFEKEISAKTGWGKNEIMVAFDKAAVRAMIRFAKLQGVSIDNLMIFSYGEKGNLFYISSANREDIVNVMKEFIARETQ